VPDEKGSFAHKIDVSCVWVAPVLGVGGRLLYAAPLFRAFSGLFREFKFVAGEFGSMENPSFDLEVCGGFFRLYRYDRKSEQQSGAYVKGVSIAWPRVFIRVIRLKPELLIVSEFSLFSFYARVLLVVETNPPFDRSGFLGKLRYIWRRTFIRLADAYMTNNTAGREYLTSHLRVEPSRVIAKPYLVSEQNQQAELHDRKIGKVGFLYVGDLVRRKGLHHVVDALSRLPAHILEQIHMTVVGDGPSANELRDMTSKSGLDGVVTYTGRIEYELVSAYYNRNSVFLFPTLGDYRALAPFEALAHGMTIVDSIFNGGVSETVDQGRNGYVIDPRDVEEVSRVIEKIVLNKDDLTSHGERSLEMARLYTLSEAVDTLRSASLLALTQEEG